MLGYCCVPYLTSDCHLLKSTWMMVAFLNWGTCPWTSASITLFRILLHCFNSSLTESGTPADLSRQHGRVPQLPALADGVQRCSSSGRPRAAVPHRGRWDFTKQYPDVHCLLTILCPGLPSWFHTCCRSACVGTRAGPAVFVAAQQMGVAYFCCSFMIIFCPQLLRSVHLSG